MTGIPLFTCLSLRAQVTKVSCSRVSFSFLPKGGGGGGGQSEIVWIIGGGGDKYISVCKACVKLGGSGGMFPWKILIFDLLLDAIWWNLGLFFAQA